MHLPHPLADVLAATVPDAVVECVAAWPTDLVDVEVGNGVASGDVRLPATTPPAAPVPVDAARVRALVVALRALLAALEPAASPAP